LLYLAFYLVITLMTDLIECLTLTLTPLLSHVVTFDETVPCQRDVFECTGDKEMEESIFVDDGL
jgi:hypothetical protein